MPALPQRLLEQQRRPVRQRRGFLFEEARLLDTRPRHTPTRPPKHPRTHSPVRMTHPESCSLAFTATTTKTGAHEWCLWQPV
jgi:hypothetical protein